MIQIRKSERNGSTRSTDRVSVCFLLFFFISYDEIFTRRSSENLVKLFCVLTTFMIKFFSAGKIIVINISLFQNNLVEMAEEDA